MEEQSELAIAVGHRLNLKLNTFGDLFSAPAVNPFSTNPLDILGRSGINYLQREVKQQWPGAIRSTELVLELPAAALPNELDALAQVTAQTESAIQRYCAGKITANQQAQRLVRSASWRQLFMALILTGLAILVAIAVANGWLPAILPPFAQGLLAVLALLTASLALWDVLEVLFFHWVPFAVDNRAYRAIGKLRVSIESR